MPNTTLTRFADSSAYCFPFHRTNVLPTVRLLPTLTVVGALVKRGVYFQTYSQRLRRYLNACRALPVLAPQ